MTIPQDIKAKILRYHHVEKWRVGTIASQLGVHHSTIKRVLSETGVTKDTILVQKSMIDPFVPFILDQLKRYPPLPPAPCMAWLWNVDILVEKTIFVRSFRFIDQKHPLKPIFG